MLVFARDLGCDCSCDESSGRAKTFGEVLHVTHTRCVGVGEVAADGITVNNIMPGYTRTERLDELAQMMAEKQGISADEFRGKWEKEIPMGRLGEPREFAALATFLVSERASYITGTSIQVDGGWIKSLL